MVNINVENECNHASNILQVEKLSDYHSIREHW